MIMQDQFSDYTVLSSQPLDPCESHLAGLSDAYGATAVITATASSVATVATVAAGTTLITVGGTLAATLPVIGWIAGAIAAIGGILLKVFGKRKQRKAETKAIREQIKEMKEIGAIADAERQKVRKEMVAIQNQLLLLGYTDIVKNNPIPTDQSASLGNAKEDLADAKKDFEDYSKILDQKQKSFEADQKTLVSWYDSLTGAKKRDNIILGVGLGALAITLLLLLPKSKSEYNG